MISAPPMPMNARLAVSCRVLVERAADAEPRPNRTMPICSAPLRPNRSLRLPVVSSSPANTRVYASMIHWISLFEALRSLISEGIATLRIVLSMTMISKDRHSTPNVHHRRAWMRSSSATSPSTVAVTTSCLFLVRFPVRIRY